MEAQGPIPFDDFVRQLPRIFDALARQHQAVLVEKEGKIYTIVPPEQQQADIWANYDPQKAREALRASAGALKGVDREQLLADIHAQRAQKSRRRKVYR